MSITAGLTGLFLGLAAVFITFDIVIYLLVATAFYFMFKKANIRAAWLSYIPVGQLYPFFQLVKVSQWNYLWLIAPLIGTLTIAASPRVGAVLCTIGAIVYVIVSIRWLVRLLKAFGVNPLWLLGLIGLLIPFLQYLVEIGLIVLYCILGFNKNIKYNPNFDGRS